VKKAFAPLSSSGYLLACEVWARPASKEGAMPSKTELGKRLREERLKRSMTLKHVEDRAGVSATHISQIERGITWPTVNALDKVAKALDRHISFFLEDVQLPEVCVLGSDRETVILSEQPRVLMRPLTNGIPGGKLHFYMMIAHPCGGDQRFVQPHSHEGDECGCVLSGHIQVKVGEEVFDLKKGDAIHFNAFQTHGIRNMGTEVSESVWAAFSLGF
jgi:transcriptional regulator with XRE-family HTH domain